MVGSSFHFWLQLFTKKQERIYTDSPATISSHDVYEQL
jgi:hypothetical protein